MANLFGAIFDRAKDLVSYPVEASYKTITNPKEGLSMWKNLYTHNTHEDQDLFQNGFGIRGWVGDHPQESAAALVASIFGGWAAAGAYGAGSAGAAGTGAAGASGAGLGAASTTGVGATGVGATSGMGAAGTGLSSGVGFGSATTGATGYGAGSIGATPFATGSSVLSYAPSSSTVLGGSGGSLTAGGTVGAGSAGATAGTGYGSASVGSMPFSEGSSVLSYQPTQSTVLTDQSPIIDSQSNGVDWQKVQQGLNQLSKTNQDRETGGAKQAPQANAQPGRFSFQAPTSTSYSQAQQILQQALSQNGGNPYSTNPFRRN